MCVCARLRAYVRRTSLTCHSAASLTYSRLVRSSGVQGLNEHPAVQYSGPKLQAVCVCVCVTFWTGEDLLQLLELANLLYCYRCLIERRTSGKPEGTFCVSQDNETFRLFVRVSKQTFRSLRVAGLFGLEHQRQKTKQTTTVLHQMSR